MFYFAFTYTDVIKTVHLYGLVEVSSDLDNINKSCNFKCVYLLDVQPLLHWLAVRTRGGNNRLALS